MRPAAPSETTEVRSAGGVVVSGKEASLRVALMQSRYHTWVLPKGKIEPGEEPEAAAAREIAEEIGATGLDLIGPIGHTQHTFQQQEQRFQKRIAWFLFRAGEQMTLKPDPKEHSLDCGWFTPAQALQMLNHADQRRILRKALAAVASNPVAPS
jgi:8-oxo-dGTP pyrophosphatase MutT (NUDIX family)